MESGVERLASAERALHKVQTGLKLVDTVLKLGEGAGLPLIPAVCSAARGVLQAVQTSRTVINDALSAAQRTIDVLELLKLMANNVERMDGKSRASVEDRMRELQRLLEDVRSAVAAFGKKGWLRHALKKGRRSTLSQLDSEITSQLDLLLKFYYLARDADIIGRLQAREYAVEAEVERQVTERKALGEAVDAEALEKDSEVVRGIAVASGVSDAEFQEELTREMREGFAQQGLKLDKIIVMMANLSATGNGEPDRSSRMSLYAYDRKPNAPPGQKDKLAARLGKGSFGVTYRMRKVAGIDARLYAVKMIESEELGGGLEKEARLLSTIDHENTLRFYDAFWHDTDDDRLFVIVTELLTGGSLAEKIAAAPPPPEVEALMRQVASGLSYMHSLNLQHRDLKPANVMLDAMGRAKIIDFGLACVSSASRRSRTKTKVGTDAYMSPEKAVGKRYGPADDVWAAGCILAELLLGRTIGYVALDAAKRQRAIEEGKSACAQLGSWVEGCLQEIPGRRPAAAVLEQGLASGGPGAREAEERSRREAAAAAAAAADEEERERREAADRSRREAEERSRREAAAAAAAAADAEERECREAADRSRREAEERSRREAAAAAAAAADEEERVRREAADRNLGCTKYDMPGGGMPGGGMPGMPAGSVPSRGWREEEERELRLALFRSEEDERRREAADRSRREEEERSRREAAAAAAAAADAEERVRREAAADRSEKRALAEISSSSDVPTLVALVRDGSEGQKENAVAALRKLTYYADNKYAIARAGGIAPLVALARGGTGGLKQAAAEALRNLAFGNADIEVAIAVEQLRRGGDGQKEQAARVLALHAENPKRQVEIARAGSIAPLVALARDGTGGGEQQAAAALWWLAGNPDNQVAIARVGGIAPLVALARDSTPAAAGALRNLALNDHNQVAIAKAGGIAPLVAMAQAGTDRGMEQAAGALAELAYNNADNQAAIARAGGIAPLVAMVRSGSLVVRGGTEGQKEAAAGALWNLACNTDNQVAIAKAGGIAPLVALARGGTNGQKERAAGALRNLSCNKANLAAMKDLRYGKKSFFGR